MYPFVLILFGFPLVPWSSLVLFVFPPSSSLLLLVVVFAGCCCRGGWWCFRYGGSSFASSLLSLVWCVALLSSRSSFRGVVGCLRLFSCSWCFVNHLVMVICRFWTCIYCCWGCCIFLFIVALHLLFGKFNIVRFSIFWSFWCLCYWWLSFWVIIDEKTIRYRNEWIWIHAVRL